MKDLLQKLPLKDDTSFLCRTYRTPYFETPWHYHVEYELVLMTEGSGDVMVGDYLGKYEEGDVFFLGSNLPHWFRKEDPSSIGSAIVIQFRESFLGNHFFSLPELKMHNLLLERSARGIQLTGRVKETASRMIQAMQHVEGYKCLRILLDCLFEIGQEKKLYRYLALTPAKGNQDAEGMIAKAFEYTFAHFTEEIKVESVARLLNMSESSFMRFFKQNTKKTYIQFLKEVRLSHACSLLAKTRKPISNICSESGYNNWTNFCRQFREIKGMSPSDYRKKMTVNT